MRSCYVAIPLGVKDKPGGGTLDFDYLYLTVIKPAVEELDMQCRRLDEFFLGAVWHKTLFTALIMSELMIADLSTQNPNVLYELGVRHAMKRGRTIIISAEGHLPGDIDYTQALRYEPDRSGRLTGEPAKRFRTALQSAIGKSQRTVISDSPIYDFFPDLQVMLPPELESGHSPRRTPSGHSRRAFAESVVESPAKAVGELQRSEEEIRRTPKAEPVEYLNLLRKYRDLSEWDRVIALADDAPPVIAASPEVQQLLALALNRRGASGDQERAIAVMGQLVTETGGDAQSFGILGLIYKERYERARSQNDTYGAAIELENALQFYRKAFAQNPADYYPGINVVNLLLQRNDELAREEISIILPHVRAAVHQKREAGPLDVWDLVADLQLAAIARDWPMAEWAARQVAAQAPSEWMLEGALRELRGVGNKLANTSDRNQLDRILGILRQTDAPAEMAE